MKRIVLLCLLAALGLLATACRKEVEKIVVQQVDKQYSWAEAKQLYGNDKIIVGMGKSATTLFLQVPFWLGFITPQPGSTTSYATQAAAYFPNDLSLRVPLTSTFVARPAGDTILEFFKPTPPTTVNPQYHAFLSLHKLDPRATGIVANTSSRLPFGATDRNNYLLFGYSTTPTDPFLRFVLTHVTALAAGQLGVQAQTLAIPAGVTTSSYINWIVAIDDYFLVNCNDDGLYKITEAGVVKKVFSYSASYLAYKWHGTVYAVERNNMLLSNDDGATWQRFAGTPDTFNYTTYHPVGDSLVAVTHLAGTNSLFTLRWSGLNYAIRPLKNDGLGQVAINDLQQLGDTVYLGTTGGLFKRPLSKFFESKP